MFYLNGIKSKIGLGELYIVKKKLVVNEILGKKTVSMLYFLYLLFTQLIKNIRPKDKIRLRNAYHMGLFMFLKVQM